MPAESLFLVVDAMQFGKLPCVKDAPNEHAAEQSSKKDHMACVLDAPQAGPEPITSPAERVTIREALKHRGEIRDVSLRALITPSRRAVQAEVNEVTACAAAQVEAGHLLRLRVPTGALCADFSQEIGRAHV